jgi:hypothetical protein
MKHELTTDVDSVASHALLCFGIPCDLDTWLQRPESVLRHFREGNLDADGVTAREINRRRWGSYVPISVDVQQLKACARHGLVRCEKGKWFIQHNVKGVAPLLAGADVDTEVEL